jgi:hypothetical protein
VFTTMLMAAVVSQAPWWSAAVTVEPSRESLRYRFDTPSSFDTEFLVPHFFEQRYDTRNTWVGLRVDHPLFAKRAEARVAMTPSVTRSADDFDTFYQPDGNVIVSGTTGTASLRSWRFDERVVLARVRGADTGIAVAYRHDAATFNEGIGIVTTTKPPTETRTLVTTREFTSSRMLEIAAFASASRNGFSADARFVPAAAGRLAVRLPDKYPGSELVFTARYASVGAEVRYGRRIGGVRAGAALRAETTRPWQRTAAVYRRSLGLLLELGSGR